MMTNLFSIFDPCTDFGLSLNWVSIFVGFLFFPLFFWTVPTRISQVFSIIIASLKNEMSLLLGKIKLNLILMLVSIFIFIFMNNVMGLMPYVFTASSHLSFTLSLALPMWVGYMLYGWIYKTIHMFAHMVPQGTPFVLMFFMVIIESISNIIRPLTLSVRLAANMIAGHLLLALMGGSYTILLFSVSSIIIVGQIALFLLEIAVAAIQAYVFAMLSTLYISEI